MPGWSNMIEKKSALEELFFPGIWSLFLWIPKLCGEKTHFQRKNLKNAWQSLLCLVKSTCFSGCLGWVPVKSSSCHLFLGDGRWAEVVGALGPEKAQCGWRRLWAPLGLSGCPLPPPTLRTLPLLFPVPWAVAQQAVNISWWCWRAKLVKSESLSLYIIPTEKLPRRPYSSLSRGKPITDTQWLLFSCHQRTLLLKKKTHFLIEFFTPPHTNQENLTLKPISPSPSFNLRSCFANLVSSLWFLHPYFWFCFCWKIFKRISGFP